MNFYDQQEKVRTTWALFIVLSVTTKHETNAHLEEVFEHWSWPVQPDCGRRIPQPFRPAHGSAYRSVARASHPRRLPRWCRAHQRGDTRRDTRQLPWKVCWVIRKSRVNQWHRGDRVGAEPLKRPVLELRPADKRNRPHQIGYLCDCPSTVSRRQELEGLLGWQKDWTVSQCPSLHSK